MKVLLMDLDIIRQRRAFPNLALMKLSAYYKKMGADTSIKVRQEMPRWRLSLSGVRGR